MSKINQMAVRMAAKDLDAAQQYLELAAATLDHAELILGDEAAHDPALGHERRQTKLVKQLVDLSVDSIHHIDLAELRGYTPPERIVPQKTRRSEKVCSSGFSRSAPAPQRPTPKACVTEVPA